MAATVSPDHVALGRAVRELREQLADRDGRPLSQEDLAFSAQIHRNYWSGIERGERNLAYTNLLAVSAALGVKASELLALAESKRRRLR